MLFGIHELKDSEVIFLIFQWNKKLFTKPLIIIYHPKGGSETFGRD